MGKSAEMIKMSDVKFLIDKTKSNKEWRLHCILLFGYYTMFRVSDYYKLTWGDLFYLGKCKEFLTVGSEKKTGKRRKVLLNKNFVAQLESVYDTIKPRNTDFIIHTDGDRRKPLTTRGINYIMAMAAEKYSLSHFSSHSLRKCGATTLYESMGANEHALHAVSMFLNHSNVTTTMRYLGLTEKIDYAIMNNL